MLARLAHIDSRTSSSTTPGRVPDPMAWQVHNHVDMRENHDGGGAQCTAPTEHRVHAYYPEPSRRAVGPTRPIDRVRTALVRTMRTTRHHLRGPRANRAPGYIYAQRGPGVSVLCGGLYAVLKTLEMNARRPALAAFVTRGARPGLRP